MHDESDIQLDAAMFDLRRDVAHLVRSPGTPEVRRTVSRRRIVRRVVAGVMTVTAVAGVSTAALAVRPDHAPVAAPTVTNAAVRKIDWGNQTLTVPTVGECLGAQIAFTDGVGQSATQVKRPPRWYLGGEDKLRYPSKPAYGDVDGDSVEEVFLRVECMPWRGGGAVIAAYALRGDRPVLLGVVADGSEFSRRLPPAQVTVRKDGVVLVPGVMGRPDGGRSYVQEWIKRRWNGQRFERVEEPRTVVDATFEERQDALRNFPAVSRCPAMADPIPSIPTGSLPAWEVSTPSLQLEHVAGDVTGDGRVDQLMKVVCMTDGQFVGMLVAALSLDADGKAYLVGTFAAQRYANMEKVEIKDGTAHVTVEGRTTVYRWAGDRFAVG